MAGLFPFLAAGLPMFQSFHQHSEEMDHARRAHKESLEKEEQCHKDSQKLDFLTHHRQVALDKEAARRENTRDVWTMRTQRIQNLMLADTVMLGAGVTLAVEGVPAPDTDRLTIIIYTVTVAFCFCFLLLSMWCIHAMQQRMNQYNVSSNKQLYYCNLGKQEHATFNEFYKCHCSMLNWLAVRMFFLGTAALLLGIFLSLHSKLNGIYGTKTPGLILWSTLFILLVLLACLRKVFPYRTSVTEETEMKRQDSYMQLRPESASAKQPNSPKNQVEHQIQPASSSLDEGLSPNKGWNLEVQVASSESSSSGPSLRTSPLTFEQTFSSPISFDTQLNIVNSTTINERVGIYGHDLKFPGSPTPRSTSSSFSITKEFNRLERKAFLKEKKPSDSKVKNPSAKRVQEELPDKMLDRRLTEVKFTPPSREHIGLDRHIEHMLLVDKEDDSSERGKESSLGSKDLPKLLPLPRNVQNN